VERLVTQEITELLLSRYTIFCLARVKLIVLYDIVTLHNLAFLFLKTHFIHEWVLCILISWSLIPLSAVAPRLSHCVHF